MSWLEWSEWDSRCWKDRQEATPCIPTRKMVVARLNSLDRLDCVLEVKLIGWGFDWILCL